MTGGLEELLDFCTWLKSLPFKWKIVIAGNHDLTLDSSYKSGGRRAESDSESVRSAFEAACSTDHGIIYLQDELFDIHGIRIFGTPWQPEFGDWAFGLPRGAALAEKWQAIPEGVDILLVHGPPLGRGDLAMPGKKRTGCANLLDEVQNRIRPRYCVFGHIHEGAGVTSDGTTHFINACSLNENYEAIHPPFVFDLPVSSQTS